MSRLRGKNTKNRNSSKGKLWRTRSPVGELLIKNREHTFVIAHTSHSRAAGKKNRIPPHGIAISVCCHRKSSFELEHRIARIGEFFCIAHAFSVLCTKVRKGLSRKIGNTQNDVGYSYTAIAEL